MKARRSVLIVLLTATAAQEKASSWKAGTASAVITPETLMWMGGYAARKAPAEGAEMDLFAKALVLEDGEGGRVAILTADLIGVSRGRVSQLLKSANGA